MRLIAWIAIVFAACVLQYARLAGWTMAPDLGLALGAWALVCGDARAWMWRLWLIGPIADALDPGSEWFHAGAHLALVALAIPLRRWLSTNPWVALATAGAALSLAVQAIDAAVSGPGGWTPLTGLADAALTALAAMAAGWLVPAPRRTVAVEAEPAAAPSSATGG